MISTLDIPAVIAARQPSVILPCSQLPELDAAVKASGGNISVLETGHRVSAGTDRNGRSRTRRDPNGYTAVINHARPNDDYSH